MSILSILLSLEPGYHRTCMPSFTGRPARLFFMLKLVAHRDPRDMWQRQSTPQLGGEVQSHRTHDSAGAHLRREVRSGAIGHVVAPEPTSAGR
jgi:hypothetical protein